MNNKFLKYAALFFMLFFIYTAPTEASGAASQFGDAAVVFLNRFGQFLTGLLDGASS